MLLAIKNKRWNILQESNLLLNWDFDLADHEGNTPIVVLLKTFIDCENDKFEELLDKCWRIVSTMAENNVQIVEITHKDGDTVETMALDIFEKKLRIMESS